MGEIETSFVSACTTLNLLAKLLDFQKNICSFPLFTILDADNFVKELAKIDPKLMKKYNFEAFLDKPSLDGYRTSIIIILHAYVDRRITFKNTLGTINGNLKQAEARENRRS